MIVPARNESELLPQTLGALLDQDVEGMEVFLVDDGSTDGSADVARRLARDRESAVKFHIVEAAARPGGWSGKVHALNCGYEAVIEEGTRQDTEPPEWLLLTDADIRHRPGSVAALLRKATLPEGGGPYSLVSIMARLRAVGFWERLVVPAFVFFFQLLYPFRRVADRNSRVAAAAGGCVLVRRSALEAAGGFNAISGAIIDDVALGRAIKEAGESTWLGFDPGISSLRPYPRLADLWLMVSRTAFTQLGYRWDLLVLTLLTLAVVVASPPLVLGLGGLEMMLGDATPRATLHTAPHSLHPDAICGGDALRQSLSIGRGWERGDRAAHRGTGPWRRRDELGGGRRGAIV